MTQKNLDLFWFAARLFVGIILAYAGFMKLMEPIGNFEAALENFSLIPRFVIPAISHVVPWMEWILGILLIVGYAPRISSTLAAFLFLGFLILIGNELLHGSKELSSCGCFGEKGVKLTPIQGFSLDLTAFFLCLLLGLKGRFPMSFEAWLRANR